MILPFVGALDFLLAVWTSLPLPIFRYINAVFYFFFISCIIRGLLK